MAEEFEELPNFISSCSHHLMHHLCGRRQSCCIGPLNEHHYDVIHMLTKSDGSISLIRQKNNVNHASSYQGTESGHTHNTPSPFSANSLY